MTKINLNRVLDLEDTKGMIAFFYRQLCYNEIFSRKNLQDSSKSDDSDSISIFKSFLDFLKNQNNEAENFDEKKKLSQLESNSENKF